MQQTPPPARSGRYRPEGEPALLDWACLAGLIIIGGSSFAMIRGAVETIPPAVVSTSRLWIGAIALVVFTLATRRQYPPLLIRRESSMRFHPDWAIMLACGAIGNAIPFFLFPWAQQFVPSGLAGVYMAVMPIWTLGLAALFAGERMTRGRVAGFFLGFSGVLILMGPSVLKGAANTVLLPQLALVAATLGYAISAVLARNAPDLRPRVLTSGIILCAAILSTPTLFFTDLKLDEWSSHSLLCVVGLGLLPTSLGNYLLIVIINRVGASFMSFANYFVPVFAVFLGAVLFGERLEISVLIALMFVIAGLVVSQNRRKAAAQKPHNAISDV